MINEKFNKLTVLSKADKLNGRWFYNCLCECGAKCVVSGSKIKNGHTKSCGCWRKILQKNNKHAAKGDGIAAKNRLITSYQGNAKKKQIEFALPIAQMELLFRQNCHYCGVEPSSVQSTKCDTGSYRYNGIDRVDNTKGYLADNVVPCCTICNFKKGSQNYTDFIDWLHRCSNHLINS